MFSEAPQHDDIQRIALYVQVSSALRNRIAQGEWPVGTQLPKLDDLAEQYRISRNTMRQALDVLRSEGLVVTARGKGIVVAKKGQSNAHFKSIREIISNPFVGDSDLGIKVLACGPVDIIPPDLGGIHSSYPEYVQLKKLHAYRGVPYELIDVYIESQSYRQIPVGLVEKFLLHRLMTEHCDKKFASWHQEITVGHADIETSRLLDYSMTRPLVRMRRQRLDQDDKILLASTAVYRGDMFVLDMSGGGSQAPYHLVQSLV